MAKASSRRRNSSNQHRSKERESRRLSAEGSDASLVPRAVVGALNGTEVVAVGALRTTRDVLLGAVSGTADIGVEALTATMAGIRGMVSATSQMVGDIAGTAQDSVRQILFDVTHLRGGALPAPIGRRVEYAADGLGTPTRQPGGTGRGRRRGRRQRGATSPVRASVAA